MGKTGLSAIVYCRTSTLGQRDAETIVAQRLTCKRIVEHQGLRLLSYGPKRDGWLEDDGVSGSLLQGRRFAQLVTDLESGKVKPDYLVVHSLSRIAREDKSSDMAKQVQSAQDWGRIKAVLRAARVKVLDMDGENDPNNVLFDLKTTLAGEEYKLIRARTMAGKARCMSEGRFARGGRPPYGYKQVPINGTDGKDGFKLIPHPENASRVRKVLGWFCDGGYAHAARKANEQGWPPSSATTKRRAKAQWNDSVRYMIVHARNYLGEQRLQFGGETYTIKYPPLIDAETYAAIVRAQKEYTLAKRTNFLSTGLVDCSCGKHAFVHSTRGKHMVTCRSYCGRMRENEFSAALWATVVLRLVQIAKHEGASSGDVDRFAAQAKAANARVSDIEASMGRLFDAYDSGEVPERIYKLKNAPLKDEHAMAVAEVARITREREAREQRRATEQSLASRVGAVLEDLVLNGTPDLDRRRALLAELLGGGRATLTWPRRTASLVARSAGAATAEPEAEDLEITLPAARGLPAGRVQVPNTARITAAATKAKRAHAAEPWAEITLPAFRELPPATWRTDEIPDLADHEQLHVYMSLRMAGFTALAAKYAREKVAPEATSRARAAFAVPARKAAGRCR